MAVELVQPRKENLAALGIRYIKKNIHEVELERISDLQWPLWSKGIFKRDELGKHARRMAVLMAGGLEGNDAEHFGKKGYEAVDALYLRHDIATERNGKYVMGCRNSWLDMQERLSKSKDLDVLASSIKELCDAALAPLNDPEVAKQMSDAGKQLCIHLAIQVLEGSIMTQLTTLAPSISHKRVVVAPVIRHVIKTITHAGDRESIHNWIASPGDNSHELFKKDGVKRFVVETALRERGRAGMKELRLLSQKHDKLVERIENIARAQSKVKFTAKAAGLPVDEIQQIEAIDEKDLDQAEKDVSNEIERCSKVPGEFLIGVQAAMEGLGNRFFNPDQAEKAVLSEFIALSYLTPRPLMEMVLAAGGNGKIQELWDAEVAKEARRRARIEPGGSTKGFYEGLLKSAHADMSPLDSNIVQINPHSELARALGEIYEEGIVQFPGEKSQLTIPGFLLTFMRDTMDNRNPFIGQPLLENPSMYGVPEYVKSLYTRHLNRFFVQKMREVRDYSIRLLEAKRPTKGSSTAKQAYDETMGKISKVAALRILHMGYFLKDYEGELNAEVKADARRIMGELLLRIHMSDNAPQILKEVEENLLPTIGLSWPEKELADFLNSRYVRALFKEPKHYREGKLMSFLILIGKIDPTAQGIRSPTPELVKKKYCTNAAEPAIQAALTLVQYYGILDGSTRKRITVLDLLDEMKQAQTTMKDIKELNAVTTIENITRLFRAALQLQRYYRGVEDESQQLANIIKRYTIFAPMMHAEVADLDDDTKVEAKATALVVVDSALPRGADPIQFAHDVNMIRNLGTVLVNRQVLTILEEAGEVLTVLAGPRSDSHRKFMEIVSEQVRDILFEKALFEVPALMPELDAVQEQIKQSQTRLAQSIQDAVTSVRYLNGEDLYRRLLQDASAVVEAANMGRVRSLITTEHETILEQAKIFAGQLGLEDTVNNVALIEGKGAEIVAQMIEKISQNAHLPLQIDPTKLTEFIRQIPSEEVAQTGYAGLISQILAFVGGMGLGNSVASAMEAQVARESQAGAASILPAITAPAEAMAAGHASLITQTASISRQAVAFFDIRLQGLKKLEIALADITGTNAEKMKEVIAIIYELHETEKTKFLGLIQGFLPLIERLNDARLTVNELEIRGSEHLAELAVIIEEDLRHQAEDARNILIQGFSPQAFPPPKIKLPEIKTLIKESQGIEDAKVRRAGKKRRISSTDQKQDAQLRTA